MSDTYNCTNCRDTGRVLVGSLGTDGYQVRSVPCDECEGPPKPPVEPVDYMAEVRRMCKLPRLWLERTLWRCRSDGLIYVDRTPALAYAKWETHSAKEGPWCEY